MKKNIHLQAAEEKIFVETKVPYVDPDLTARKELKEKTKAANVKHAEFLKDREAAEKYEPFTWG